MANKLKLKVLKQSDFVDGNVIVRLCDKSNIIVNVNRMRIKESKTNGIKSYYIVNDYKIKNKHQAFRVGLKIYKEDEAVVLEDLYEIERYSKEKMKEEKMKTRIILISGLKGCGKTFNANRIIEKAKERKVKAEIVSFASPLKKYSNQLIIDLFGEEMLEFDKKENIRPIYQAVGMVARGIDKNFWINKAMEMIDNKIETNQTKVFVIDDARFPNELEMFDNVFDTIKIKITRKSIYDIEDTDETETSLNDYDKFDIVAEELNTIELNKVLKGFDERKRY